MFRSCIIFLNHWILGSTRVSRDVSNLFNMQALTQWTTNKAMDFFLRCPSTCLNALILGIRVRAGRHATIQDDIGGFKLKLTDTETGCSAQEEYE